LLEKNEAERAQLTKEREDLRLNLTSNHAREKQELIDKHDGMRNSLTIEMEQQRLEKDRRHAELEDNFEKHRNET
jgi:hypothetical protein